MLISQISPRVRPESEMVGTRIEFVGGDVPVSFQSWAGGEIPELTRRVARRAFPKGSLAIRLRDSLGQGFEGALFAAAFLADGRPAVSPGVLAMVSVSFFHPVLAGEIGWSAGLVTRQGPSSLAW
ncbi:hypothetical protein ACWCQZ_46265 [Streptomyces sp. NPDC002285]